MQQNFVNNLLHYPIFWCSCLSQDKTQHNNSCFIFKTNKGLFTFPIINYFFKESSNSTYLPWCLKIYIIFQLSWCVLLLPYFIEYNVHMSIVHTWISQWFGKKLYLFFKNNFTRINHCKFIHHKSHLKPFLSYLPCIVRRKYFSIIFNVKNSALYSIKYGSCCSEVI